MLAGFFLLVATCLSIIWTIVVCKNEKIRSKEKDNNPLKKRQGMPRNTKRDSARNQQTPAASPAVMAKTPAESMARTSEEKESRSTKSKKTKAGDELKFGALVEDDEEPELTNLEDLPEDKNPLLDRSVQCKLLPAHVLARTQHSVGTGQQQPATTNPSQAASTPDQQKTPNAYSVPQRSMYAQASLNDRNTELRTPPRTNSSETNVADILKTPKRDGRQEHSMKGTTADIGAKSRELGGNH